MKKRAITLSVLGFLLTLSSAIQASANAGLAGMTSLTLYPEARGAALGGSHIAVVQGAASAFWNPAGLADNDSMEASLSYNLWVAETHYISLTAGLPNDFFGGRLGFASILFFEGTLTDFGEVPLSSDIQNLSGSEFFFQASYARPVSFLKLGASLKLFGRSFFGKLSGGSALDIGAQTPLAALMPGLSGGVILKNIGFSLGGDASREILPFEPVLGASYAVNRDKHDFLFSLAGSWPVDDVLALQTGFEYGFSRMFFGRGGYQIRLSRNNLGALSGLTFGLGMVYRQWDVDFSIRPMGVLGTSVQFTLGYKFL